MKKAISTLLVLTILITAFAGCSSPTDAPADASQTSNAGTENSDNSDIVTPAGEFPIVAEPYTLDVFIAQHAVVADLNSHKVPEYIEENLGIILDMQIVPQNAILEKQNLALSTGTYPSVFMSGQFTNSDVLKLGVQDKILVPINDAIDNYGIEIKGLWEQQEYLQSDMTAPDGNIYAIPSPQGTNTTSDIHRKLWVNGDWLEKLDIEDPTTTEEFKDMLLAFKNDDPNGNGLSDEVPLSGAINTWAAEPQWFIMNFFVETEPFTTFTYIEGDELVFAPLTDAWKDGLAYMADLYSLGLIDPASLTQDITQLQQLARNPGVDIVGAYTGGHLTMGVDRYSEDDRGLYWRGLSPVSAPGYEAVLPVQSTERKQGGYFAVTDKCENIDVAVRLADWLLSEEGWLVSETGWLQEGAVVEAEEGQLNAEGEQAKWHILSMEEKEAAGIPDEQNSREHSWSGTTLLNQSRDMNLLFTAEQDIMISTGYSTFLTQQHQQYFEPFASTNEQIPPVWIGIDDMEAYSTLSTPLADYIKAATAEFITGARSLDDWDTYVTELNNLGYEEWFAIYSTAVEERLAG